MRSSDITSLAAGLALASLASCAPPPAPPTPAHVAAPPRYQHVFVIIEENQGLGDILNKPNTPNLTRLAQQYGIATHYYGNVHPSEGNYVAMLGGDTFGIHDDDAYYCQPRSIDKYCPNAKTQGYDFHTVQQPGLTDQLAAIGLSWKGYFGSLPADGSPAVVWPAAKTRSAEPEALYASKHNGFMNFATVQHDPNRALHIVNLGELDHDIAANNLPAFAHIVPNQCDDMHGLSGPHVSPDCAWDNPPALIARGDRVTGDIVDKLMRSAAWTGPANTAIVITFDEDAKHTAPGDPQGCCGWQPGSLANFGGGHIATIVITNHGPRHLQDPTPYSHYSLLRTIEDLFGIDEHLGHASDPAGVVSMTPLFAIQHS